MVDALRPFEASERDRKVQPLADGSDDEADEFGRKRPDEPDIRPRQIYCELNTCLRRS